MKYIEFVFKTVECVAFILPALPNSVIVRLSILLAYFIAHCCKLQMIYLKFKNNCITDVI
jgi:hypothetical protein